MAPPAPGSSAGPASCDVTGQRHHPAEGGIRKRAALGGPSATFWTAAPPTEEMERSGRRVWSPSNLGKAPTSASTAPRVHPPPTFQSRSARVAP
ncbi:unnamed protein product [Rangifer tarandus platyrhynchus]|uniref:Uncharacterized protein n=2 Tax=Rangifer tarandus platyrhynchus TaxID=3082113 RepID=A0ACB0DQB3_RANTA|nr:unnamed protein product [Rangifer tarandus platyrhynchus]CAI9690437.1 unnamed protein product [Rangifer tarandus platyrhynchus]